MAIIGIIDNYVSRIAAEAGLWQFHATRTLMALPVLLAAGVIGFGKIWPRRPWAVGLRSLFVGSSMVLYFGSLGIMPIAQALAGLFSSPIWVLLIAVVVFRQRIGWIRVAALVTGFGGVLLVLQPDPAALGLSLALPLMSGFLYALGAHATRKLCAEEDPLSLLAANYIFLGSMGAIGLVVFAGQDGGFLDSGWRAPSATFLWLTALQAFGSLIGVYLLIRAYQMADTSIVAILEYSVMIFGPAYAWVALGQPLGSLSVLGLLILTGSAMLIVLRGRGLRR